MSLDAVDIQVPCHASWEEMKGDARVRFCGACKLNVYNLSEMARGEAEALVQKREGRLCVRFYRRPDGTVLTKDCRLLLRARKRLAAAWAVGIAAVLALAAWVGFLKRPGLCASGPPPMVMGGIQPAPKTLMGDVAAPRMGEALAPPP